MTEFRPKKCSEIQTGDILSWSIPDNRGALSRSATVIGRRGLNVEIGEGGMTDWLYWPQLRYWSPTIKRTSTQTSEEAQANVAVTESDS